jgi:hypothetical protein
MRIMNGRCMFSSNRATVSPFDSAQDRDTVSPFDSAQDRDTVSVIANTPALAPGLRG